MGVTNLFVLLLMLASVTGNPIVEQTTVEVVAGSDAYLSCVPTVNKPVVWQSPGPSYDEISFGGRIRLNYRKRFSLSSIDQHSLLITGTVPGDAGEYRCIEDNGIGPSHSVVLDVREAPASPQYSTDHSATTTKAPSLSTTSTYTQVADVTSAHGQLIALVTVIIVLVLIVFVTTVAIVVLLLYVNSLRKQVKKYRDMHASLIPAGNDH